MWKSITDDGKSMWFCLVELYQVECLMWWEIRRFSTLIVALMCELIKLFVTMNEFEQFLCTLTYTWNMDYSNKNWWIQHTYRFDNLSSDLSSVLTSILALRYIYWDRQAGCCGWFLVILYKYSHSNFAKCHGGC